MQETDIIPFKTSPLPEGPWLIFAPHADDETFGMGGSLLLANKANISVSLLILTDGAKGGSDDSDINELIETRRQEVLQVVEQLGIIDVTFLEQPDQHLISHQKLIQSILKLIEQSQAKSVFIPALTEFHPDHRATAYIAWQALTACDFHNNIFSYEITSQQAGANYLIDISPVIDDKRQVMELYQSQLDENNYIDSIISINKSRTYTLPHGVEYAEAFHFFSMPDQSLTLNTIEQFRPYWEQEKEQTPILISVILQTQNNTFSSIDSVLQQTYPNIELILINNGHHSKTKCFQQAKKNLTHVQTLDLSPAHSYSTAANKGLELCQGDFILILDEGDIIYPGHIESLLTAIREDNASIVYSDIESSHGIAFKQAFDYLFLLSDKIIPIHGLLFSRQFLNTSLRFNTTLNSGQHWDFLMQLSQQGDFKYLNTCGGFSQTNQYKQPATFELFEQWIKIAGADSLKKTFQFLEKNLEINEQSFHQQSEQISALSLEIQTDKAIIDNKDRAIKEKDQAISEKISAITEKDCAISEKDYAISEKESALIEKNEAISELFAAIKEKDKLIDDKNKSIENLNQNLSNVNTALSEQYQLFTNSLSWRMTKPLRKLKSFF
ncbi:MAG: PIG-L family deacetylase [gamma proteobacterium symbiont of Taylorina sp.]|nr:PIG-L family deacetylase [gamma proteobacterium symbiont of Taylorina sp.]